MTFKEYAEIRDQQLQEMEAQWPNGIIGLAGRTANAVASGLGAGVKKAVERGTTVAKYGNAVNKLENLANKLHKAITTFNLNAFDQLVPTVRATMEEFQEPEEYIQ